MALLIANEPDIVVILGKIEPKPTYLYFEYRYLMSF